MDKITYPNEFTYQPPVPENEIQDEKGNYYYFDVSNKIKQRNAKQLIAYLESWYKRIAGLKLYGMNNILGDVFVYADKNHICVEVTSNISFPDNMGGRINPQEAYRKKLIGKHVTTIRNMFRNMGETNFCSADLSHLSRCLMMKESERSMVSRFLHEAKYDRMKIDVPATEANLANIEAEIIRLKGEIDKEKEIMFPAVTTA